jgi:hypothetical protein
MVSDALTVTTTRMGTGTYAAPSVGAAVICDVESAAFLDM